MPNPDPGRVMSPLNLIVKLQPGTEPGILGVGKTLGAAVKRGADTIGTLHEARFVRLAEDTVGVFTTYDGDFDAYIFDFTKHMSEVFNILMRNAVDPPPLPVEKNPQAFADWVRARDLPVLGDFYSAYPTLSVQDIKTLATASV